MENAAKNVTQSSIFERRRIVLDEPSRVVSMDNGRISPPPAEQQETDACTVLVINSSREMAKEITMQLALSLPGCSIIYAPTIALARWVLSRRPIGLVISSPILPDGSVAQLQESLERMESPPDVVVVGNVNVRSAEMFKDSSYEIAAFRRLGERQISQREEEPAAADNKIGGAISSLGADLRNDLNNPLQEIVAMVFVAQAAGGEGSGSTNQALGAIDSAAKNMAKIVNGLEERIRDAMEF